MSKDVLDGFVQAMPEDAIATSTIGPNECLFVPAGWLVVESTQSTPARGLRRIWLTDDSAAGAGMLKHHGDPVPVVGNLRSMVERIVKNRSAPAAVVGGAASAAD
eukprot:2061336-Lingulodinium_polyedra.AAC.1